MQKPDPIDWVDVVEALADQYQSDEQLAAQRKYVPTPAELAQGVDAGELDVAERALISRGLELALLGERLQQTPDQPRVPRLSRRQRRELERIQRRAAKRAAKSTS